MLFRETRDNNIYMTGPLENRDVTGRGEGFRPHKAADHPSTSREKIALFWRVLPRSKTAQLHNRQGTDPWTMP
jgi:hypothetical protein